MSEDSKLNELLTELRNKGHLPALDANVAAVCSLTSDPLAGTSELTSVILRDPALTTCILSTANSALYPLAEPVTTVSSAVLLIGFACVRTLALGLGLFKQIGSTVQDRKLYRLLVFSYFSGMFARALGQKAGKTNTEELLVAGMLSQLPRLLLAHTFPERYAALEKRMASKRIPLEQACQEVFETSYHGLGDAIAEFWGLPANVTRHLRDEPGNENTTQLLKQASHLARLIVGDQDTNIELELLESDLQQLLKDPSFRIGEFIRRTCESDPNVSRFFRLSSPDVDRMLSQLERGKVNPGEVTSRFTSATKEGLSEKPVEDPSALLASYLTELTKLVRGRPDVNRVLLTALEAIYRCVRPGLALLAFPDANRRRLEGRFLLGAGVKATDFVADLQDERSTIVRCLKSRQPLRVSGPSELPGTLLAQERLGSAWLVPIVVARNSIGLCVVARDETTPITEQEELWIEAVVTYVALAFDRAA